MDRETSLRAKSLKEALREEMQRKRKQAQVGYLQSGEAQKALCDNFTALLEKLTFAKGDIKDNLPLCAGYFPMHSEIDPRPLMRIFAKRYGNVKGNATSTSLDTALDTSCLLPVVRGKAEPLLFRHYDGDEQQLEDGAFATKHPPDTSSVAEPSLLLVPLLAFDKKCQRLGYGGGFYDRTIAALRERARTTQAQVFTIGIAYEAQLVASMPSEPHDLALDAVLSERRIYYGAREGNTGSNASNHG